MNNEINAKYFEQFIFGGNSYFTMTSKKTGTHFTFHITTTQFPNLWYVNLVDNHSSEYIGYIKKVDGVYRWFKGRSGKYELDNKKVFGLMWVIRHMKDVDIDTKVTIQHVGRCCKCGRKLTTPKSIELGMGPECAKSLMEFFKS